MELTQASVTRFWDAWEVRLLVLLSLTLQIILSLSGRHRKYVSSLGMTILVWLSYLSADWAATFALSKLSDAQVDRDHRNALWVIWAPLLLLHLGAPDTITAYSSEDNQLWTRHLFGLVVQTSVAIYVIVMSWKHSWFSTMSIPALVAGLIKYGERVWVLMSVSLDKSKSILPVRYRRRGPRGSNFENNNSSDDENSMSVLYIAHEYLEEFIENSMQFYDLRHSKHFTVSDFVHDIDPFWDAIETEMGLMFDLLHTKAAIKFRKEVLALRCISFTCTMTVLIGLICRVFSMRVNREKWKEVDVVITVVLLVGALAMEIYAVIASYLFSDWAMLWLLQQNRGKQRILQLRNKIPWLFRPKQYQCRKVGQFDLLDFILKEPHQRVRGRIFWALLKIDRFKGLFEKYVHESAYIERSLLHYPILYSYRHLSNLVETFRMPDEKDAMRTADVILWDINSFPFSGQIVHLHIATNILCFDTRDDISSSSSLWEKNRNMCRTLSRYMMYLLITHSSLLPVAVWGDNDQLEKLIKSIKDIQPDIGSVRDVVEACEKLEERISDRPGIGKIVAHVKKIDKKELRWEALKLVWVRMLCYAASKGQTIEHLGQLSQGGEFLTFLWFFLPQSRMLESHPEGLILTKPIPESGGDYLFTKLAESVFTWKRQPY